jgi:hypothetical protein
MAETSIKIELALVDKTAQKALDNFIGKAASAERGLDKLKKTGDSTFHEISVGIGKSIGVFDIFVGNIAANVAIKAFDQLLSAANALFQTFIVDGVHAAIEQQDAINSLNVALAQSGHFTKEASADFVAFAETLQGTTTFADDVILKNAALIESLAQLDSQGLKQATIAALDLSAALGKDLETASQALGKAASGNVTALQKMGIEIQKGRTDAETFANALKAVEDRFSGAAISKVNTYSGAVAQAGNTFGDLQEEIGNLIVQNPAVINAIKAVSSIFVELTQGIIANKGSLIELVGEGLSKTIEVMAFTAVAADTVVRVFQSMVGVVQKLLIPVAGLTSVFKLFTGGLDESAAFLDRYFKSADKNFHALGEQGDGALAAITTGLLKVKDATDKGLVSLASGADGTVEPLNRAGGAIRQLTEEQKRAQEALKAFSLELVKDAIDNKKSAEEKLTLARATADQEIAIFQSQLDNKLISIVDFATRKAEIEAEFQTVQTEIDNQKFLDDQTKLQDAFNQKLISENQFNTAKQQLNDGYLAERVKRDAKYKQQTIRTEKEIADEKEKIRQMQIHAVGDTFGQLSSLMNTNSRKLFEVGKAASIAQATINAYEAASKAWAMGGPFGAALAAATLVGAMVQVTNIAKTQPRFEDGGIVGGSSLTGDNLSARVNSGEMILNRSQQGQLFQIANGAGGGSNVADALNNLARSQFALAEASASQPISIKIGEKEIFDVIRTGISGGRRLTP